MTNFLGKARKNVACAILVALLTASAAALAQEVLTNEAVVKMVKGGLSEDLIVKVIQRQPGKYSTTPNDLIQLKRDGVSDKVLSAMLSQATAQPAPADSIQKRTHGTDRPQAHDPAIPGSTPANAAAVHAAPGGNNTFFKTWRDPRENAFDVGVPEGWRISGGLMRQNAIEPHFVLRAQSPDGQIQIFLDDPDLHPFETPDQMTQMAGVREGQAMKSAWGGSVVVARYQTGGQFAQQYIRGRLCRQAMITDATDLPEPTMEMNQILQLYAMQQRMQSQASVGEATYRCGGSAGYVMANTFWIRASGPSAMMWFVFRIGGYQVSDPEQSGLAYYVLNTMWETLKTTPEWDARNARDIQDVTGSVTKAQNEMAKSSAQYAQRQASSASAGGYNHPNTGQLPTDLRKKWAIEYKSAQKYSDATMGQTWVHSSTGENVRVSNSYSNWWKDASGNVVAGAESGSPPGSGYERLQPGWEP